MTKEQIEEIADLPGDVDFRFESHFGQTILKIASPEGVIMVYPDGMKFWWGQVSAFVKREYIQCRI